ncbi:MAG: endonuclease domain-containing protein, partial [Limnohabitans sp.]|nr:endonuclease domain-containing protein [Limnohabitans sp.]
PLTEQSFPLTEQSFPLTEGARRPKINLFNQSEVKKITPKFLQTNNINTHDLIFSDNFLPYNPMLIENSRKLRKARNLSEVLLWEELRADKFLGYSFCRQKPILHFIADFYCKELNLVIEIDGNSHDDSYDYDKERDRQMEILGLKVIRFLDIDVKKDMQNVLRKVEEFVEKLTPPNPLTAGELTPCNEQELKFSPEATAVFDAGRELWTYYHTQTFQKNPSQSGYNVNASLYDIREYFQGRNDAGKMNNKSSDETYMSLIGNLREKLKKLATKIEPKVYQYEFLK